MTNKLTLDTTTNIVSSFYSTNVKQDGEIDLFEIFSVLYRSKWLIVSFIATFSSLVFCYLLFSPQKWKSEAVIIQPTTMEMFELNKFLSQLKVLDIKTNIDASQVYIKFLTAYRSPLLQENFLINSDYFQKLAKSIEPQSLEKEKKILRDIISDINITNIIHSNYTNSIANKQEGPVEAKVELSAEAAQDAQNLLSSYLHYIESNVRQEIKAELNEKIVQQLIYAKGKYAIELADLKNANLVAIQRLKNSLAIAQSVGIKKPVIFLHNFIQDDPDYPIALGSKALAKKLAIIEKNDDLSSSNFSLLSNQLYIQQLQMLNSKDIWFQPVKYIQKPTLPIEKQTLKQTHMVLLAIIVGLIFGCIYVLLRHMVNNCKQRVR